MNITHDQGPLPCPFPTEVKTIRFKAVLKPGSEGSPTYYAITEHADNVIIFCVNRNNVYNMEFGFVCSAEYFTELSKFIINLIEILRS